jgi:glucan 1,3-beta-glucosidase
MENGSGGWLEDLIFINGKVGLFAGNQQFTIVNATFNGCNTAIIHAWDWVFLYKNLQINDCAVGLDITTGSDTPAVGSIMMLDSTMHNVDVGVLTTFSNKSTPVSAGTLVLDNVEFINTDPAIAYPDMTVIAPGNRVIDLFLQGRVYSAYESSYQENNLTCYGPAARSARVQQQAGAVPKSPNLLDASGRFFLRSKPQYEGVPVSQFKSSMDFGCLGDGFTDDTVCVQNFLNSIQPDQIAYFDHGYYIITDTIECPINIKIHGEFWPVLMVMDTGNFGDIDNPKVAFRVGKPGDVGAVEITDMLFETRGPTPGAIILEWNLAGTSPGAAGMWDTHFRIGGTNGTLLQSSNCAKVPTKAHGANLQCYAAFLLLHVTKTASLFMSNNWGWVADHEMDLDDHNQIDIYNGRGLLVESQGPLWIYGSSFEHSMLYNYNFAGAKNIFMGVIQHETA